MSKGLGSVPSVLMGDGNRPASKIEYREDLGFHLADAKDRSIRLTIGKHKVHYPSSLPIESNNLSLIEPDKDYDITLLVSDPVHIYYL